MWSYTDEESSWLSGREEKPAAVPPVRQISPEEIERALVRAHRIRAAYFARCLNKFGAWLKSVTLFPAQPASAATVSPDNTPSDTTDVFEAASTSHALRTPISVIRSYAEILRDHPEASRPMRERYLGIVVAECKRLENAVLNLENRAVHGNGSV